MRCLKIESENENSLARHTRFPSPLVGEGARATSAFTRVFDALWRGRVRGYGVNEGAKPLTRLAHFVRSPPSPTRGEGKSEQAPPLLPRKKIEVAALFRLRHPLGV